MPRRLAHRDQRLALGSATSSLALPHGSPRVVRGHAAGTITMRDVQCKHGITATFATRVRSVALWWAYAALEVSAPHGPNPPKDGTSSRSSHCGPAGPLGDCADCCTRSSYHNQPRGKRSITACWHPNPRRAAKPAAGSRQCRHQSTSRPARPRSSCLRLCTGCSRR